MIDLAKAMAGLTHSGVFTSLKRRARARMRGWRSVSEAANPSKVHQKKTFGLAIQGVIETIDELDAKIEECNRAEKISDDAMRGVFKTFWMAPPANLPGDPFSSEYRDVQFQLYEEVSGRRYNSGTSEVTKFDVESAVKSPFPFNTQSCHTTGEHLMLMGFLLRTMELASGSKVIEFGPGWGNTTVALAQLGHHVTAIDIEPCFCELIKRRAVESGLEINVINDDFMGIKEIDDAQFDAAVFFECFHHASDHLALLRELHRIVKPGGRIYFGGEPITSDFPMPWGLRLDGQSLWSIRKCGWLELGFQEDYFINALEATGWCGIKHSMAGPPSMNVWEARAPLKAACFIPASDMRLQTHVGTRQQDAIVLNRTRSGTALFGPYIVFAPGAYIARVNFSKDSLKQGRVVLDICARVAGNVTAERLVERHIDLTQVTTDYIEITIQSRLVLYDTETRVFCEDDCTFQIVSVEFIPTN